MALCGLAALIPTWRIRPVVVIGPVFPEQSLPTAETYWSFFWNELASTSTPEVVTAAAALGMFALTLATLAVRHPGLRATLLGPVSAVWAILILFIVIAIQQSPNALPPSGVRGFFLDGGRHWIAFLFIGLIPAAGHRIRVELPGRNHLWMLIGAVGGGVCIADTEILARSLPHTSIDTLILGIVVAIYLIMAALTALASSPLSIRALGIASRIGVFLPPVVAVYGSWRIAADGGIPIGAGIAQGLKLGCLYAAQLLASSLLVHFLFQAHDLTRPDPAEVFD